VKIAPNRRSAFGAPVVIGVLSLSGLLSALLFDGIGRYFSWIAVGMPIILVAWLISRRMFATRSRRAP
jgi:hypothetical protein